MANMGVGKATAQRPPKDSCLWRDGLAAARPCFGEKSRTRAGKQKIGAGEGWLPREMTARPMNGGRDAVRPRVDGCGAPAAR
jgi:hypothetical protein